MKFSLTKPIDTESFFGREPELSRLATFLSNEQGGTLLVSGERGAGKSTLVGYAIERIKKLKGLKRLSPLRLTRSKTVFVELPYLPKHLGESDEKQEAKLTSLILKALVQTLVTENDTRIHPKIDIRRSWFRPIGYTTDLNKLDKLTRFTEIIEQSRFSFGVKSPKVLAGGSRGFSYNHDLSDTILEVRLRKLLYTYSKQLKLIFVFDELDKLEEQQGAKGLTVESFVHYLKNLFTHSGGYFIFVTTDETYLKLEKDIKQKPYGVGHTLFTEKFLLNNLDPKEFQKWIRELFELTNSPWIEFEELCYSLAWHTRQHPFDTLNVLRKAQVHGSDKAFIDEEILKNLLDPLTWTYHSAMQVFVDYVFCKYRDANDNFFNKMLYMAIRTAAQYIIDDSAPLFNRNNALTLIFTEEDFDSKVHEADMKREANQNAILELIGRLQDWRVNIGLLSGNQRERLEVAITELVFTLNREGSLRTTPYGDDGTATALLEVQFIGDGFSLSNIERRIGGVDVDNIEKYHEPTQQMREDLVFTKDLSSRFFSMFDQDMWSYFQSTTIKASDGELEHSTSHRYALSMDSDSYHQKISNLGADLQDQFVNHLNQRLINNPSTRRVQFRKVSDGSYRFVEARVTGRTINLFFNGARPDRSMLEKGMISNINLIYDQPPKLKTFRRSSWIDMNLNSDWSNYQIVNSRIVTHIEAILS